jgi:hypothetical protein
MAQIIRVTSEALQATIRRLLPSQQGFGEDLQASNIIQPIIDLTPTAEGSEVRQDLQTAFGIGNGSLLHNAATTVTVINTTGFWKCDVFSCVNTAFGGDSTLQVTDGTTTNEIFNFGRAATSTGNEYMSTRTQFVVFLAAGESLTSTCPTTSHQTFITYRQIATVNGELVNPLGFTPQ